MAAYKFQILKVKYYILLNIYLFKICLSLDCSDVIENFEDI